MSGDLLTSEEVGRILGVKPQTLACWRLYGKNLSFIKVSRLVRYRREDLERFLVENSVSVREAN